MIVNIYGPAFAVVTHGDPENPTHKSWLHPEQGQVSSYNDTFWTHRYDYESADAARAVWGEELIPLI
jgi:hypothetical protein